jgi:hypothetical protein
MREPHDVRQSTTNPSFEYDSCDVYDGFYLLVDSLANLVEYTVPETRLFNEKNRPLVSDIQHDYSHMVVPIPDDESNCECIFKALLEAHLGDEVRSPQFLDSVLSYTVLIC